MNSGLLIFREVAESWNSGNSTKSTKTHKTRKIPQNSSVILSNTYLYNIFWNFTCMFTCCKLANLYWNFVTETSKQCPKSTGVDYVAKNCMALALMLKALPFNFAIGSFLECVVVERANDNLCLKKTLKASIWSAQSFCPENSHKISHFQPVAFRWSLPWRSCKIGRFFQGSVPHNPTKLILTFFPDQFYKPCEFQTTKTLCDVPSCPAKVRF